MLLEEITKLERHPLNSPLIPPSSGVYFIFEANHLLYVGSSRNMRRRIAQHCPIWPKALVSWLSAPEVTARTLETGFISSFAPPENRMGVPVESYEFHCLRCQYDWNRKSQYSTHIPRYCPHCKSPMWNTPRQIDAIAKQAIANAPAVPLGYHNAGRQTKKTKACPSCGGINGLHQKGCEK